MRKKRILLACISFALFLHASMHVSMNKMIDSPTTLDHNEYGNLGDMPLEMVISRRMSIHSGNYYDLNRTVPWELVTEVLWAAYGYSWEGRTVPSLSRYPVIIYVCNETAAYKFVPENQSLTLLKEGDYRELGGVGYPAPIQLFIAFDTNICEDVHWGNAESGCPIQNIYLMANALNLGTVCTNDVPPSLAGLGLPENEKVLYKMPLGYPLPPYTDYQNLVPTSRPSSSKLPEIQDGNLSLEDALDSVFSSHEWSENPVTKQELSQVLWASYGYSYYWDTVKKIKHRTVPSAHAYYPMRIYAANSSGVYQYLPEQHSLTTIVAEDRRLDIALASGNTWVSSAPLIIAMAWNDSRIKTVDTTYIEAGLITQNVYLESAAWGLIADWVKADIDEVAMREALGLIGETHLHPASIITVGHPDTTPPTISILSPENKTYATSSISLNFTVNESSSWIGYDLDGQTNLTISGNTTLTGLFDGSHYVVVYTNDTVGNMGSSDIIYFTVDATPPTIEVLCPTNITYTTTSVPLDFVVNEPSSWIGYSLDGQANVTITGNTTLISLPEIPHYVIVYANDTVGNMGCSETLYFTVKLTQVFDVVYEAAHYPVAVQSNSTILNFDFNQSKAEISFDVTGKSGTVGYCNVTIPNDLLWGNFTVYVNETAVQYMQTSNSTHITLYFTYSQSTKTVHIQATEVIPEFPSIIIMSLFMLATLLAVIVYRRKPKKKP